jgi:hypothetical protein
MSDKPMSTTKKLNKKKIRPWKSIKILLEINSVSNEGITERTSQSSVAENFSAVWD